MKSVGRFLIAILIAAVAGLVIGWTAPYIGLFFKGLGKGLLEATREIVLEDVGGTFGQPGIIVFCLVLSPVLIPLILICLAALGLPMVFGLLVVGMCAGLGTMGAVAASHSKVKATARILALTTSLATLVGGYFCATSRDMLPSIYLQGTTGILVFGWIGLVLGAIVCLLCVFGIASAGAVEAK